MKKRLMTALVALVMLFSSFSMSFATVDTTNKATGSKLYADVDGHWATEAIYRWSDYGLQCLLIIKGNTIG